MFQKYQTVPKTSQTAVYKNIVQLKRKNRRNTATNIKYSYTFAIHFNSTFNKTLAPLQKGKTPSSSAANTNNKNSNNISSKQKILTYSGNITSNASTLCCWCCCRMIKECWYIFELPCVAFLYQSAVHFHLFCCPSEGSTMEVLEIHLELLVSHRNILIETDKNMLKLQFMGQLIRIVYAGNGT